MTTFRVLPRPRPISAEKRTADRDRAVTITLFLLPGFVLFLLFVIWPVIQSAYFSLYQWNGLGALDDFVGLQNYERAINHTVFQKSLLHSGIILVLSIAVQLPFALFLSIILTRGHTVGRGLFRSAFFIPYVFSEVITAIIWSYVYHPNGGLVSSVVEWLVPGDQGTIALLADPQVVLYAIFAVLTWKFFGFHLLLYMAALQNVSPDIENAARVSGANEWQVLRYITLPLIGSTIRLTVYLSVLGSLQQFIVVWILTEGGPINASELIVTYLYKVGIQRMSLGYGSAIAVLLFLMTLTFSLGYQRAVMRQDYEIE